MSQPRFVYVSSQPYEEARIHAAALYCSDGRIGEQIDEFLHQGLRLPRYDRLVCPGGPVALSGRFLAQWEARGVEPQLRFLMRAHGLERLVLIAHVGCAYYRDLLGLRAGDAEREQRVDLERAAALVRRIDGALAVDAYLARLVGDDLAFERVAA